MKEKCGECMINAIVISSYSLSMVVKLSNGTCIGLLDCNAAVTKYLYILVVSRLQQTPKQAQA